MIQDWDLSVLNIQACERSIKQPLVLQLITTVEVNSINFEDHNK